MTPWAERREEEALTLRMALFALALIAATATIGSMAGERAAAAELIKYEVVDEISIPASLTGKPGDPVEGRKVVINRKLGNCLACHRLPIPEQSFHGQTGPDLAGVADRYSEGELRLRVVNPKIINPDTMMPAFYRTEGLTRVMKKFQGKPILTAEQVEDVIAYLKTLKED